MNIRQFLNECKNSITSILLNEMSGYDYVDYNDYFKDKNVSDISIDSALNTEKIEMYSGKKFNNFKYFGDCINTVP